jgi:hypothetical protein
VDFKRIAVLAVLALMMGAASTASAQDPADFVEGSRPVGMGGAFTSVGTGPVGLYHNPSGIALAKMYGLGANYQFTPTGHILNASVVDSKTNPNVAAGAGYSYIFGREDADPQGHDIRLGLAVPILKNKISFGLGGRYLILDSGNTEIVNHFTLDAGIIVRPVEQLRIGVAGKNMIDVCDQATRCGSVAPQMFAGGISFGDATNFMISGDVEADFTSEPDTVNMEYQFGGEVLAGPVPIRAGYEHRTLTEAHNVSLGLGYKHSKFGVDVGGRMDVTNIDRFTIAVSIEGYIN